MKYRLYHGDAWIADVEKLDADFPTFFGRYQLATTLETFPDLAHIRAYIGYSVRVSPLFEQDRCDEIDPAEEGAFIDLIESNDWFLIASEGSERTPILVPIFFSDSGINWRLNPKGIRE